ncbi:con-Ins Im2-like [Gigantopelta aegis]|uniref:con-Ins Im2-like n=1 Tax=Gigantopelta aegis TaxID=1735272 RepID=UPI001B88B4D3|nr:con-Ins Im2-like [Gigantopelta aegis]
MPKCQVDLSFRNFTAVTVLEETGMSLMIHVPAVLVLILCVCVVPVAGDLEKVCTTEDRREGAPIGGICGERISEVLSLTCNMMGRKRRSGGYQNIDNDSHSSIARDLRLKKSVALSYIMKRKTAFGTQGITCECCYNRCTFVELAQYC